MSFSPITRRTWSSGSLLPAVTQNASEVLREGLRLIESRVITYTAPYTATYTEWPGKDLQRLVRA
jgi:hypothetical protein